MMLVAPWQVTPIATAAVVRVAPLTLEQRSRVATALTQTAATQQALAGTLEKVQVCVPYHFDHVPRVCEKTLHGIIVPQHDHSCMHACRQQNSASRASKRAIGP